MQVRRDIEASSALIELTTENGRIQITPSTGIVSLTISAADTAALTQGGIYDLELMDSATIVERLLQGNFNLDENVTT
jgi:tRNA threonylcarbamoyladenosine modification (KEOPS) complex  Pcc1 subunit